MKNISLIFLLFILSCTVWAKKYDPSKLFVTEAIEAEKTYAVTDNIVIGNTSFIAKVLYKNIYE